MSIYGAVTMILWFTGQRRPRQAEHQALQAEAETFTIQPPGVILVSPHGCLLPQRTKDSRVCSHEVDVDGGIQLSIWQVGIKTSCVHQFISFTTI